MTNPFTPFDSFILRSAPVPLWHLDGSGAVEALFSFGASSVDELRAMLEEPERLQLLAANVRVHRVSDRVVELLGGTYEDHLGFDPRFATPEYLAALRNVWVEVWKGESSGSDRLTMRHYDGWILSGTLDWAAAPGSEGPDWQNLLLTFADSTERDLLARVLAMVSEAERAVLAATTEREMFAEVCRIAVEVGGYRMAWAGIAEEHPPFWIKPMAGAGEGVELSRIEVRWDESPLGLGPSGRAVREGVPVVIDDIMADPSCAPWADRAASVGVVSTAAFPVQGDGISGLFTVNSSRLAAFGDDEVALLTRLANHLTVGIERHRRRAELEDARLVLEDLVEEKDRFLATVAHELRTPLASVLGFAEILQQGGARSPEDVSEFARMISGAAGELTGVVEDMLVAGREHPDSIRVSLGVVDLTSEVETVLDRMGRPRIPVLGSVDVQAIADPGRVRQVLRNLLSNAERYGGDHIEVRMGEEGLHAWITVADDGAPIDADHAARMFEAYVRKGVASPEPMGLGLYIGRRLAVAMEGSLTIDRDGEWNCFRLTLPRAVDA